MFFSSSTTRIVFTEAPRLSVVGWVTRENVSLRASEVAHALVAVEHRARDRERFLRERRPRHIGGDRRTTDLGGRSPCRIHEREARTVLEEAILERHRVAIALARAVEPLTDDDVEAG